MTTEQKKTLIIGSIIGTMLATYSKEERTRLHNTLHAGVGKGVRACVKRHSKAEVIQVSHVDGNDLWADAVDHFKREQITIEASSTILFLVDLDEKNLAKYYGLSRSKLSRWAKPCRREDAKVLEDNGRRVAKHVDSAINLLYGIEIEEKVSVMDRIKLMKEAG